MRHAVVGVGDQKQSFQDRLKRINSGQQYEHEDVVGFRTQKAFNRKIAPGLKKPKRTFGQKLMVLFAFLCGALALMLARISYFHLSQVHGMPEAFVNLGGRGVVLLTIVIAGILTASFHLSSRGRIQALALGCVLMHFGEAAVAANAQDLWSTMFSPEYTAHLVQGAPTLSLASITG